METYIYMVRHAESPYSEGTERTRGLTSKGYSDLENVTEILRNEEIELLVSSPYARAILTLEPISKLSGLKIKIFEDLRERHFCGDDYVISDDEFINSIESMFSDPDYALPGGESNRELQERAVPVIKKILDDYEGKRIAIGTHGNIMTIIMNYFDHRYDFRFFKQTTKPDIYKLKLEGEQLMEVVRLWRA